MNSLKNALPSKFFDALERAGLSTPKQIIMLSLLDIKKLSNLSTEDIIMIKNVAADCLCPQSLTSDKLLLPEHVSTKVTTGCDATDNLLGGGFRRGALTEIFGESGSGKTQIALQAAAHNWSVGSVYICTENMFPSKRFEQIKLSIPNYNPDIDYGKNIFVEHVTAANELLCSIRVHLPKLLHNNKISLIVIDSIAGPFRCEYTNYVQRAEDLREIALTLISTAQRHSLAVLCINQVTASFTDSDKVLPSLGLAWSNMVGTRLQLKRMENTVNLANKAKCTVSEKTVSKENVLVRELTVVFAPDLRTSRTKLFITQIGIQSV